VFKSRRPDSISSTYNFQNFVRTSKTPENSAGRVYHGYTKFQHVMTMPREQKKTFAGSLTNITPNAAYFRVVS